MGANIPFPYIDGIPEPARSQLRRDFDALAAAIPVVGAGDGGAVIPGRLQQSNGTVYYSIPGTQVQTQSSLTISSNTHYYFPLLIAAGTATIDRLATYITAGTANFHLGLYNADTDWQPTTLLHDATLTAANAVRREATVDIDLPAGRYLGCIVTNGNITFRSWQGSPYAGLYADATNMYGITAFWDNPGSYGALADPGRVWTGISAGTSGMFNNVVTVRISDWV